MRQRIGLAQALINDPELVILDEPSSGLDPLGTRWMKDLILDLRKKGKTVLMCSHRLEDVQVARALVRAGPAAAPARHLRAAHGRR